MNILNRIFCGECNDYIQFYLRKGGRKEDKTDHFECEHTYVRLDSSNYFNLNISPYAFVMSSHGIIVLFWQNGAKQNHLSNTFDYIEFAAKSLKQRQEWLDKISLLG